MNIIHYICPRACGKTTFAEKLQKEDPSLLLIERGHDLTDLDWLEKTFRGALDRRDTYTGVIIDEFLSMTNLHNYYRDRMLFLFREMGIDELTLISTPDRLYDRYEPKDWNMMVDKFLAEESCTKIIKTDFGKRMSQKEKEGYKNMLGEERYKTEMLGEYLAEPKKRDIHYFV